MAAITMMNVDLHGQLLMSMKEIKEEDFYSFFPQHLGRSSEEDVTSTTTCKEKNGISHGINGEDNLSTLEFGEITSTIQPSISSQLAIAIKVIKEEDFTHVYTKQENKETATSFCEEGITEMIMGKENEQESAMTLGDVTSISPELPISIKVIKEEDFKKILQESLFWKKEKKGTTTSLCEEEIKEKTLEKKNEPVSVVTYITEDATSPGKFNFLKQCLNPVSITLPSVNITIFHCVCIM